MSGRAARKPIKVRPQKTNCGEKMKRSEEQTRASTDAMIVKQGAAEGATLEGYDTKVRVSAKSATDAALVGMQGNNQLSPLEHTEQREADIEATRYAKVLRRARKVLAKMGLVYGVDYQYVQAILDTGCQVTIVRCNWEMFMNDTVPSMCRITGFAGKEQRDGHKAGYVYVKFLSEFDELEGSTMKMNVNTVPGIRCSLVSINKWYRRETPDSRCIIHSDSAGESYVKIRFNGKQVVMPCRYDVDRNQWLLHMIVSAKQGHAEKAGAQVQKLMRADPWYVAVNEHDRSCNKQVPKMCFQAESQLENGGSTVIPKGSGECTADIEEVFDDDLGEFDDMTVACDALNVNVSEVMLAETVLCDHETVAEVTAQSMKFTADSVTEGNAGDGMAEEPTLCMEQLWQALQGDLNYCGRRYAGTNKFPTAEQFPMQLTLNSGKRCAHAADAKCYVSIGGETVLEVFAAMHIPVELQRCVFQWLGTDFGPSAAEGGPGAYFVLPWSSKGGTVARHEQTKLDAGVRFPYPHGAVWAAMMNSYQGMCGMRCEPEPVQRSDAFPITDTHDKGPVWFLGKSVKNAFEDGNKYTGTVAAYDDKDKTWRVDYEGGGCETLDRAELLTRMRHDIVRQPGAAGDNCDVCGGDCEEGHCRTGQSVIVGALSDLHVGRTVQKKFGDGITYRGVVTYHDPESKLWEVRYEDGDCENMNQIDLLKYMTHDIVSGGEAGTDFVGTLGPKQKPVDVPPDDGMGIGPPIEQLGQEYVDISAVRGAKAGMHSREKSATLRTIHNRHGHVGQCKGCEICNIFKGRLRQIPTKVDPHVEVRPGWRWHADTITWSRRNRHNQKYTCAMRDEATGYICFFNCAQRSELPQGLYDMIKGLRNDPRFNGHKYDLVQELKLDLEGAWSDTAKVFNKLKDELKIQCEYACPGNKKSNGRAEGLMRVIEVTVKSVLAVLDALGLVG